MALQTRIKGDYTVVDTEGDLRIDSFVPFKTDMEALLNSGVKKLALNLGKTNSMDSSHLRLFININKRIASESGSLLLYNANKSLLSIFEATNLIKVFKIFSEESDADRFIIAKKTESGFNYWKYAEQVNSFIGRIPLKCPVCGSVKVFGYMLFPENRQKEWRGKNTLPSLCGLEDSKDQNFDRSRIIVCGDCFMASQYMEDFTLCMDGSEVHCSRLDFTMKGLLAKSITKRKKIMENAKGVSDNFFEYPRTDSAVITSYLLAEDCVKSMSYERSKYDSFALGYLNTMLGHYIKNPSESETHTERARTWLSESLKTTGKYSSEQTGEAFYYMVLASVYLEKIKEARQVLEDFKKFRNDIKDVLILQIVDFWFTRAESICTSAE